MLISTLTAKILALSFLSVVWLALFARAKRLDMNQPFHVASDRRDRRKARFYYLSAWIGLGVAFLSLLCLDGLANVAFDSAVLRDTVLSVTRAVGVWGLLIVGLVLSQVGHRLAAPNADGQSLTPIPNERERPRLDERYRR